MAGREQAALNCTKGTAADLAKSGWRADRICTNSDKRKNSISTMRFTETHSIDNLVEIIDGHVAKLIYLMLVKFAKMSKVVPSDVRVQVRAKKIRAEDIVNA